MTHWYHLTARNRCPLATDPGARMSMTTRNVTCPVCRQAIKDFQRSSEETLKDAPAVKRVAQP